VCGFPKRAPITVVASYSYDPSGNTTSINETGLGVPNIVRYAGGLTDLSTGMIKYGQRYYDPMGSELYDRHDLLGGSETDLSCHRRQGDTARVLIGNVEHRG